MNEASEIENDEEARRQYGEALADFEALQRDMERLGYTEDEQANVRTNVENIRRQLAEREEDVEGEEEPSPSEAAPSEEPETPPRPGTTYSGPTETYDILSSDASEEEVNALLERCRAIPATNGQCHRIPDTTRIVMGPDQHGRGEGGGAPAPERGEGTEIRFFPPVAEEDYPFLTEQERLNIRRRACQEAHPGQCVISGDRVVVSRDETSTTAYYGAYATDSDELRAGLEHCNANHGGRCWSDDGGNIQFRMTGSEQRHEFWMYNADTGEIESATEAQCGGDSPDRFCCKDGQEDCVKAGDNYEAAVEQSKFQNIWEGKQALRGWIQIFVAFGVSDEWDREAFQELIQWAETTAGLAVSGRWEESICRYTPDFDQPTSMIQYPGSGQFGIWIEGAKTVSQKVNESDPQRRGREQKLYKITGSVMPAGLTFNSGKEGCADKIKFNIMLDDDVVDLGEPGTAQDLVNLNCDSDPFEFIGQNAIYIIEPKDYDRVCFRFETPYLKQAIKEQLPDGKLCARIVESGTPEDFGCGQSSRVMQGGWGLSWSPDCSNIESAPTDSDSSRGGTDDRTENRPAPRPPSEPI